MPKSSGDLEFSTQIRCRSRDFHPDWVEISSSLSRSGGDLVILVIFGANGVSFYRFWRLLSTDRTDLSITRTQTDSTD
nr:hypothetical protein CFP56_30278 [Quercus suber]